MFRLTRVGEFEPSNARAQVQKILYETEDGTWIKVHVSRKAVEESERLPTRFDFVVSACLADSDGKVCSLQGKRMIGRDRRICMDTAGGASMAEMLPFLLFEKPIDPPEKPGYLLATADEHRTHVQRFDGANWRPWFDLPVGATPAQILLADQLEYCLRDAAIKMLDEGEKALAIDSLVPGL